MVVWREEAVRTMWSRDVIRAAGVVVVDAILRRVCEVGFREGRRRDLERANIGWDKIMEL